MTRAVAAIFEGTPHTLEMREYVVGDPRGGETLVRVTGCTLCGSDRHSFEGRRKVPVPTVLGHEIVGEIVAFGPTAAREDLRGQPLRVGDAVTWAIVANCRACYYCERGLPQKCQHAVKYGHEMLRPGEELRGGLASHCLLAAGTGIVRIPEGLPLEVACPASCATATVAAAYDALPSVKDCSVGIFGAGMLGLTASAMAAAQGAKRIVCCDPVALRCARARQFGATDVGDASEVTRLMQGQPGFDVVLELSGHPSAFDTAWPLLRMGGTLLLVGSVYPSPPVELRLEQVVRRCLTIRGLHNYAPRHLVAAIDFLAAGHREYPFASLVSEWLPLEQAVEAFARGVGEGVFRVGVRPN